MGTDAVVIVAAIAAVVWVNWYFFFGPRPAVAAAAGAGGVQHVTVRVQGGYQPSVVRARPGVPLRITFRREETSGCSEEVVFPDFGVRRFLPAHESTVIELPAQRTGSYAFTCGMGMLQGRLVVEDDDA